MFRHPLVISVPTPLVVTVATACGSAAPKDEQAEQAVTATAQPATPTPDTRLSEYRSRLVNLTNQYSASFGKIGRLSGSAHIDDASWRIQYRDALNEFKQENADARNSNPPECLNASHVELLKAAAVFDQGANLAANC
jgi:hypothetical protein